MTNTMTMNPVSGQLAAARVQRQRKRRRKALLNTLVEGLATLGLLTCFFLCGLLLLCAA